MNKNDLIKKLSERSNIPSNAAKVIVNAIFDSMKESLEKGEGIEIRGFGSFTVRKYGGYKGRNPKTGDIGGCPSQETSSFQGWERIREKVNKSRPRRIRNTP